MLQSIGSQRVRHDGQLDNHDTPYFNKQDDHIQPCHDFEPVLCFIYSSNYGFLTCKQTSQETGKVVSYFHLFKKFSQFVVINTIRSFSIVNEAEIDVFLEFPCFLHDSVNVDNLISCSSSFSKPCLYICKFSVYVLLKPSLKDFEHNLTSM